jgi:hypothetical protein
MAAAVPAAAAVGVMAVAAVAEAVGAAVAVAVGAVAEALIELIRGQCLCPTSDVDASIARMIYPLAQTMGRNVTAEKSDKSG